MLISDTARLKDFCSRAASAEVLYLDSEFVREDTYLPQLEIIQIMANDEIVLVDYPALKDPEPLWDMLHDPEREKVFHAAQQDLEIFYNESGRLLQNTFDTQVAAAFAGMGEQIGYGQLVNAVTGVTLAKSQSYTSWSRRPLSDEQIEYAQDDVRYLPPVADFLKKRLEETGRMAWAREEFETLEENASSEAIEIQDLYLRVAGVERLEPRELAVLRELAIWRQQQAMKRNWPVQRLLKDRALVSLARQRPRSMSDLREVRGFPSVVAERSGHDILDAVDRALEMPRDQWPRRLKVRQTDPNRQAVVSLLQAFLRIRSLEEGIAWGLLSNSTELDELAQREPNVAQGDLPVLSGWRYEMIGRDLLRLLHGELKLTVDPVSGEAVVRDGE